MKIKKSIIISLIVIIMILANITNVFAATKLELQQKSTTLKNQIDAKTEEIDEVKEQVSDNVKQIQTLTNEISQYKNEIDNLDSQISILEKSIAEEQTKLDEAQAKYVKQDNMLKERIVAQYESGQTSYLDVLLSASSLTEFISNYYLVSEIATYDTELLDQIEQNKNDIAAAKAALETNMNQLATAKANKEATAKSLQNSQEVVQQQVSKLTAEEKALEEQLDQIEKEFANTEAQIKALSMQSSNSIYIGGVLGWPAPGYSTITSPFGMRYHPLSGLYKMHSGVDIAIPTGANIVAANDGKVILSEYYGGYGNCIMIDHGGGIVTVYAHGSKLIASVRPKCKKGRINYESR